VEAAVIAAIEAGQRTADIAGATHAPVSTRVMGDAVLHGIVTR
jgi:hypothetical protein